jgi:hypothetical protein
MTGWDIAFGNLIKAPKPRVNDGMRRCLWCGCVIYKPRQAQKYCDEKCGEQYRRVVRPKH